MRRRILGVLAVAVPVAGLALGFLGFRETVRAIPDPPAAVTADLVAVLTGGPGRIEAGLRLLDAGAAPAAIVSGVGLRIGIEDIARLGGRSVAALDGRVTIGRLAASTRGNAVEVAAFAQSRGARRILLVTADFHLPRALLEQRRALPEAEILAVPVRGPPVRADTWLREYAKYLGALAGLSALFPAREEARTR